MAEFITPVQSALASESANRSVAMRCVRSQALPLVFLGLLGKFVLFEPWMISFMDSALAPAREALRSVPTIGSAADYLLRAKDPNSKNQGIRGMTMAGAVYHTFVGSVLAYVLAAATRFVLGVAPAEGRAALGSGTRAMGSLIG